MHHRGVIGVMAATLLLAVGPAGAVTSSRSAPVSPSVEDSTPKEFGRGPVDRSDRTEVPRATSLSQGLLFVPINPYRTFDSRHYADGRLRAGDEVWFTVLTDEFDYPAIPDDAVAVTYNLTVTATAGVGGYLAVFPADISWPGNSSINWFASGLDLANGGVAAIGFLDAPGQLSIYCGGPPGVSTHFILDITGYFV